MFVIGGIRYNTEQLPVCYPQLVPETGVLCNPQGCAPGLVCSGMMTNLTEGLDPELASLLPEPLPVCLTPEQCLQVRMHQSLDEEQSCYYPDLTTVKTKVIPTVDDCNDLDDGLCAINCPCENPTDECMNLSETHNVGVCSSGTCADFSCENQQVCAMIRFYRDNMGALQDWMGEEEQSSYDLYELWEKMDPALYQSEMFICTTAQACAAYTDYLPASDGVVTACY